MGINEAYCLKSMPNEALPQTDEVYAEDGALIAIANDWWTPIELQGRCPEYKSSKLGGSQDPWTTGVPE
jgi:hypothetical protein